MGIFGTILKVLAGVAVGIIIDLSIYKFAKSTSGSFLQGVIIEPFHYDDVIALAICVLGAIFIPNVFIKQVFAVAFGAVLTAEIWEYISTTSFYTGAP